MKNMAPFALVCISVFSLALVGCGSPSAPEPASSTPTTTSDVNTDHDHGKHAHGDEDGKSGMEKMKAELAKLSPEDAASAEKQHMCPVSGEMLGTMGAPQKVDVNDQQVWICCDGCKDKLLENPDKYLAKLNTN